MWNCNGFRTVATSRTSLIAHPTAATVCLLRCVNTDIVSKITANKDEGRFYWGCYCGKEKDMKLAVPDLISNSYFPAVAAVELGFFKQHNLDLSLELIAPTERAYAALRDGDV